MTPAAEPAFAEAVGFVLAGGESTRMGSDKALTQLRGEPLIVHALGILRGAGLPASIAGARSALAVYAPVVEDAGGGPLSGICAALSPTSAQLVAFVSIDMPLLPSSLIAALTEHARLTGAAVTSASVHGFAETFPVVISGAILPAIEAERRAGNHGCFSALRAAADRLGRHTAVLPVENLVQAGHVDDPRGLPPAYWFLNVNTPDDLARAELVVAGHRVS